MNKGQKPCCKKVVTVQEKDLRFARGAAEDEAPQHVDNPGQTPMKDDPS